MRHITKNTIYLAIIIATLSCQDNSMPPAADLNTDLENFRVTYDYYDKILTVDLTRDVKTDQLISRTGDIDEVDNLLFGDVPRSMFLLAEDYVKVFDTREERIAFEAKLYGLELNEFLGFDDEEEIEEHDEHGEVDGHAGGRTNTHCTHSIIGQTNGTTITLLDGSGQIASISDQRIQKTVLAHSLRNRADYVVFDADGQNGNGEVLICCHQPSGTCVTEDRRIMNIVLYDADCPSGGTQLSLTLPFITTDPGICPGPLFTFRKDLNQRIVTLSQYGFKNKTNSYNVQVWKKDYLYD